MPPCMWGWKNPPRLHSSDSGRDGEWCNDGHVKCRVTKSIPGRGHPWMAHGEQSLQ